MIPKGQKNQGVFKQIIADGVEAGVNVEDLQEIYQNDTSSGKKPKLPKTSHFKKTKVEGNERTLYSTGPLNPDYFD